MDFDARFQRQLDGLKDDGNYRIFADIERRCDDFPPRIAPRLGRVAAVGGRPADQV